MIFCEKKKSTLFTKTPSPLQSKLDADLKKQEAAKVDEETCETAAQKLAWVEKWTAHAGFGMSPQAGFDKTDDSLQA